MTNCWHSRTNRTFGIGLTKVLGDGPTGNDILGGLFCDRNGWLDTERLKG
jgi:hypothetical protein